MKYEDKLDDFLGRFDKEELEKITNARKFMVSLCNEKSHTEIIPHSEHSAAILSDMGMDVDSIIAALLHQVVEDGFVDNSLIEKQFGSHVALLTDELSRMSSLKAKNKTLQAAETLRKMLFAITRDLRVIIIKLAERLDTMRSLKTIPEEERKRIAAECVAVYAPLADRLGISWMKDDLEDLSLKETNREAFDQIKGLVASKKNQREIFLDQVKNQLLAEAKKENIDIEVMARAKHFYSIYQKMRKRAKSSDELYDLSGLRILCNEENECYSILGIVHGLWKPIDGRFKDYIAMPKSNGYQSLHTTVMTKDGTLLEIQIRTHKMHNIAEYGIASHWLYKKGSTNEIINEADLPIINKLKNWSTMLESGDEFLEDIKREILKDSIIVFTPKGDAIELPAGSTPLDFAYSIHSKIGDSCLAAKINGAIASLDTELKNTQIVDIQTSANAKPNVNWLKIVKTSKARSKIRQWLIAQGDILAIDKNVVAKKRDDETKKVSDKKLILEAKHPEYKKNDSAKNEIESGQKATTEFRPYIPQEANDSNKIGISINGTDSLIVRFAGCCKPAVGDKIVGYVSRGRGIIVHKESCKNLPAIKEFTERRVEVFWETVPALTRRYHVKGKRVLDLFSEIENAVKKYNGRLIEGKLEEVFDLLQGNFTMTFPNAEDAKTCERNLKNIPSIFSINRIN